MTSRPWTSRFGRMPCRTVARTDCSDTTLLHTPSPVQPRRPYYWLAESQDQQLELKPSTTSPDSSPSPRYSLNSQSYPRHPAQTSRDPRDPAPSTHPTDL